MLAVIAAAAESPRLLPLTQGTPVSALEVGEQTLINHQIDALNNAGIDNIIVITGFCSEQVESLCGKRATCHFNPFYATSHIAMNLWTVRHLLHNGFVMIYGDILFDESLVKEISFNKQSIVLGVDERGLDREAEKVSIMENEVTDIGKNIESASAEFNGIAKISSTAYTILEEVLKNISQNDLGATFPDLIRYIIRREYPVTAHLTNQRWLDIDFPEDLEKARREWG